MNDICTKLSTIRQAFIQQAEKWDSSSPKDQYARYYLLYDLFDTIRDINGHVRNHYYTALEMSVGYPVGLLGSETGYSASEIIQVFDVAIRLAKLQSFE